MNEFKIGDLVSLAKYDATNREYAFGEGRIVALRESRWQGGVVADIESKTNRIMRGLDLAWLLPVEVAK